MSAQHAVAVSLLWGRADLVVKFRAQIGWRGIDLDADELITSLEAIEDAADGAAFLAMTRDTTDMNGRAT